MAFLLLAGALRAAFKARPVDHEGVDDRTREAPAVSRARAEAEEVRSMAQAWLRRDPRLADELFAAADRHEQLAIERG